MMKGYRNRWFQSCMNPYQSPRDTARRRSLIPPARDAKSHLLWCWPRSRRVWFSATQSTARIFGATGFTLRVSTLDCSPRRSALPCSLALDFQGKPDSSSRPRSFSAYGGGSGRILDGLSCTTSSIVSFLTDTRARMAPMSVGDMQQQNHRRCALVRSMAPRERMIRLPSQSAQRSFSN